MARGARLVTVVTTKPDPLSVECPQCGAWIGDRCWSGTRRGRRLMRGSHRDRERLARGEPVTESFQTFLKRELRRVVQEAVVGIRKDKT
jgi:hypothetical protein